MRAFHRCCAERSARLRHVTHRLLSKSLLIVLIPWATAAGEAALPQPNMLIRYMLPPSRTETSMTCFGSPLR